MIFSQTCDGQVREEGKAKKRPAMELVSPPRCAVLTCI